VYQTTPSATADGATNGDARVGTGG
jgi:hypothetical protein